MMGEMLYEGRGCRKSPAQARKFWRKAADAGDVAAWVAPVSYTHLFDQYLKVQGQTVEEFRAWLHAEAERKLRSRMGLLLVRCV